MRRWTMILIGVTVVAIAAAVTLHQLGSEPEWSTSSEPALAAFEEGLDAEKQLYYNEAREHYARAVELDPTFAMARFKLLLFSTDKESRAARLRELVDQTDLSQLSERERFLMLYRLALMERDQERAITLLDDYLAREPNDLSALAIRCDRARIQGSLDEAADCYERVLQIDPKWVVAQNQLGYIKMGKGEFAEAERYFAAYLATAPDQANPHDSLGELFMLTGRYEQARREFETAISIRPDFCASIGHLTQLALLEGDVEGATASLERGEETVCPPEFNASQKCQIAIWLELGRGDYASALARSESADCDCNDQGYLTQLEIHRAARLAGDPEAASRIEALITARIERHPESMLAQAMLEHMRAMRLIDQGRIADAIPLMQKADSRLAYNGEGIGLVKLYNRLALADALEATGSGTAAEALRREVRAVNPSFADRRPNLFRGAATET